MNIFVAVNECQVSVTLANANGLILETFNIFSSRLQLFKELGQHHPFEN